MPVATAKVAGRRKLDFASLQEVLADADRLSSGPITMLGNWSAGQIFRHLATAYNGSIDGFTMTFPWYFRLMATVFKKKLVAMPMPPGFNLPGAGAKEMAPAPASTEEGLAELHSAVARLENDSRRARHPMLGDLTKEQWNQVHLNHANLHMSFLVPQ
jgi:Protein of unknown function (DUF1569)